MASCNIHPFIAVLVALADLLCTAQASPSEPDRSTTAEPETTYHAYTEDNITYSTLEQIMQDIATSEGGEDDPGRISHRIDKRYDSIDLAS